MVRLALQTTSWGHVTTDQARGRRARVVLPTATQTTGTIAVFGATGQQGGAVVDALLDRGARVRALVRNPQSVRAQALAARGVELAAIRTDDPASLATALTAVEAFYFMTPAANSLEEVEAEIRVGTALVDAAVAARVPHVVFNSVIGADRERVCRTTTPSTGSRST